jgi:16S rRNA (uracil1498-N3)-methyltransferase
MVQFSGDNVLKIILWEDEKNTGLRKVIPGSDIHHSMVLVGPEGGFTGQEVALARQWGFHSVGLAGHILRTETAVLYVLSVLHYEWETFP